MQTACVTSSGPAGRVKPDRPCATWATASTVPVSARATAIASTGPASGPPRTSMAPVQ